MSKAYNIIEASNMINTEFKVVYKNGENRVRNVYVGAGGTIVNIANDGEMTIVKCYGDLINAKFYKVKKQVGFFEAVKSGKPISFRYDGIVLEDATIREIITGLSLSTDEWIRDAIEKGEWCIEEDD